LGLKQAVFPNAGIHELPEPSTTGLDEMIFEWAPNPARGIAPLKAIASGGEDVPGDAGPQSVLAEADAVPTLVFDEIDADRRPHGARRGEKKLRKTRPITKSSASATCPDRFLRFGALPGLQTRSKSRTFAVIARLDSDENA